MMSDEKTKLKSVAWWASVLIPAIVLSVGAWFGGVWWHKYEDRPRFLEYTVSKSDAMIPSPETGDAEMEVSVGGRKVDNLSSVKLTVFNNADQDFEEADLIVRLSNGKRYLPLMLNNRITVGESKAELTGKTVSFANYIEKKRKEKELEIQSSEMTDAEKELAFSKVTSYYGQSLDVGTSAIDFVKRNNEFLLKIDGIHNMPVDDWVEYKYKLTAVNRFDPVTFQAEYLFGSSEPPEISVELVATSLGIKKLEITENKTGFPIGFWIALPFMLLGFAVFYAIIDAFKRVVLNSIEPVVDSFVKKLDKSKSDD